MPSAPVAWTWQRQFDAAAPCGARGAEFFQCVVQSHALITSLIRADSAFPVRPYTRPDRASRSKAPEPFPSPPCLRRKPPAPLRGTPTRRNKGNDARCAHKALEVPQFWAECPPPPSPAAVFLSIIV